MSVSSHVSWLSWFCCSCHHHHGGNGGRGGRGGRPPGPPFPPWWWWQLQQQNQETWDDTDIQPTTCEPLPHDVQAPPPFQYEDQTVTPNWDDNLQQWGFWFGGKWHPLYAKGC